MIDKAIEILKNASSGAGISASSSKTDNYNRIWARDSAVASLAIIAFGIEALKQPIKSSIMALLQSSSSLGQIPSNVLVGEDGVTKDVSFGGPVGRTDSSFWWLIMAIKYLMVEQDESLKNTVHKQAELIFNLSDAWEFNGKNLMHVPMSSNWADEYVTNGYVLYDQLVRLWALELSGNFFNNQKWLAKSDAVRKAIKLHYLFEGNIENSLFTKAQQEDLKSFDLSKEFIASFSPGDRVNNFDAWSAALLLLLKVPSTENSIKLEQAILTIFNESENRGIPAFHPIITSKDTKYKDLQLNYSYRFKNLPGHFHNGGIWPVVNGFLISALAINGFKATANKLHEALTFHLQHHLAKVPFPEYFDFFEGQPNGVSNLCFSAAGFLIADLAISEPNILTEKLFSTQRAEGFNREKIIHQTRSIIEALNLTNKTKSAISIAGESGCGKTTLSGVLKEQLEKMNFKVIVLHQDDYFVLPPKRNHEERLLNFDHIGPTEARLSLIDEHIRLIKQNLLPVLQIPKMNWSEDIEESVELSIKDVDFIIVEGTYTSLLNEVENKLFINTNYKETKQNRLARNREEVTDFIEQVLAKESKIIQSHQYLANLVLDQQMNIVHLK